MITFVFSCRIVSALGLSLSLIIIIIIIVVVVVVAFVVIVIIFPVDDRRVVYCAVVPYSRFYSV